VVKEFLKSIRSWHSSPQILAASFKGAAFFSHVVCVWICCVDSAEWGEVSWEELQLRVWDRSEAGRQGCWWQRQGQRGGHRQTTITVGQSAAMECSCRQRGQTHGAMSVNHSAAQAVLCKLRLSRSNHIYAYVSLAFASVMSSLLWRC